MTYMQQQKPKQKTFIIIPAILLVLSIGIPSVFAGNYGYQATNPDGGEVTKSKGSFWTYLGGLASSNIHVDRMIYLTDVSGFTVGVGYYDSTNGAGTESYKWLRYWDEGATYDNLHYLSASGPGAEGWSSIEVLEVDSDTYDFKVAGSSQGTLDCHTASCNNPTITGVASWSTSTSGSDRLKADFKDLTVDDAGDADSGYISWNTESTDYKCNNSPSTLKFELPLASNNIDQVQIDLGSVDECAVNSSVWLYNGGSGG